jgi:hypothetical protein
MMPANPNIKQFIAGGSAISMSKGDTMILTVPYCDMTKWPLLFQLNSLMS